MQLDITFKKTWICFMFDLIAVYQRISLHDRLIFQRRIDIEVMKVWNYIAMSGNKAYACGLLHNTTLLVRRSEQCKGSFTNYVTHFSLFFNRPPTHSNVLAFILSMSYLTRLCNSNAFADHPPTPCALRNLWMGPNPVGRQARWKMSCLQKRFGLPLLWQTLLLMMHHPHVIILLCTRPTLVDQAVWRPFCHMHSVNISQIIRWFIQLVIYLVGIFE